MKRHWIRALIIILAFGSAGYYIYQRQMIFGIVSDGRNRLAHAVVRIQATEHSTVTDTDGTFRLWMPFGRDSVFVTAWKDMYFIAGRTVKPSGRTLHIKLRTFLREDNEHYEWVRPHPDPEEPMACANCHEEIYSEWLSSTHATTAQNEKVVQMYLGTDAEGNAGVLPGVRLETPQGANMPCGGCHMPTAAITEADAYVVEPGDPIYGADQDGVHCDFCHKIVKAYPNEEGNPGGLSVDVMRPFENSAFPQLFVGSLDDVVGRDTYMELYNQSLYCAPCHVHIEENKVPVYMEYQEWLDSPYAEEGVDCQDCHMKPSGTMTNFAPAKPGMTRVGVERDPMTIPTHHTPGVHDSTFLASAVEMDMDAEMSGNRLEVEVRIENVYGGHHVPTSSPDRNMLLLVEATVGGRALPQRDGSILPPYAGEGDDPNDWAGLPGKGFTKMLVDTVTQEMPVAWWRHTAKIFEDTRIPARATDITRYTFDSSGIDGPIHIKATLYFRKTYKAWADAKKWNQQDQVMARLEHTLQR